MAKRWFKSIDASASYYVYDTESKTAEWFDINTNKALLPASASIYEAEGWVRGGHSREIPDPRPARYVRYKDQKTGKGIPWPGTGNADYMKIEKGAATIHRPNELPMPYEIKTVEKYLANGVWIEVPESEIFPPKDRYFKWVGPSDGSPMLWIISPGRLNASTIYAGKREKQTFDGCGLLSLGYGVTAEFFPASLEAALDEVFGAKKDRYFRNKLGTALWVVPSGKTQSTYYRERKPLLIDSGYSITTLLDTAGHAIEEFFPSSLDEALNVVWPKTRYFRTTDETPWLWVVAAGEKLSTCYRSREEEPWYENNDLESLVKSATEFFPANLEEAFDTLWPLKDRYFRTGPSGGCLWVLPAGKALTTFYSSRDDEGAPNNLAVKDFIEAKEFFPGSLEAAKDAVWPKKNDALTGGSTASHAVGDSNVAAVVKKLQDRSAIGIKKYGTTTDRKDIDRRGWLSHLQQELLDACVYIERTMKEMPQNGCARVAA